MIKLKDNTVNVEGLHPEMYFALGLAEYAFAAFGKECVITAALDGEHNPGSKHPLGLAVDLHNADLETEIRLGLFLKLRRLERYGFDVIDERPGQTGQTTAAHFHIEYDPKPGERVSVFG